MIPPAQFLLSSPYDFIGNSICNQSCGYGCKQRGDGNIHGIKGSGQAAVILVRHMDIGGSETRGNGFGQA